MRCSFKVCLQYDLRQMRKEVGIAKINPGLTDWAQVDGRVDISLEEKVNLDLYYFRSDHSFEI